MPQKLTIMGYTYDELSDKAKLRARDWYRKWNDEFGDSREIKDALEQTMDEAGLGEFKVYFALGYCQGDGVDFEGRVDIQEFFDRQRNIAWQIANQRTREVSTFEAQHVREGVVVGAKAMTGIDYTDKDANHVAIKNSRGGYDTFRFIRPDPEGQEVAGIESLPNGKVRITLVSAISPAYLEYLKELAIDSDTLAALEELVQGEAEFSVDIKHQGHYHHWNAMNVSVDLTGYGRQGEIWVADLPDDVQRQEVEREVDSLVARVEEGFEEYVQQLSRKLEREGYGIIEDRDADETIAENIRINEYLFTEAGRREYILDAEDGRDENPSETQPPDPKQP